MQYRLYLFLYWASLMHKPLFFISSFTTLSHDFFGLPLFIRPGILSSLTLFIKFVSSILSRCPSTSVWSLTDDSLYLPLLFYLSASHSEFHHKASFHTSSLLSFSFLLPAFVGVNLLYRSTFRSIAHHIS